MEQGTALARLRSLHHTRRFRVSAAVNFSRRQGRAAGPPSDGVTGPLMPLANGTWAVPGPELPGAGALPGEPLVHPAANTTTASAALVHEARRTLLEVGGDRLDLVGTADEPADGPFLGGEALGQRHGAGQVQERLGPPHRVR